MIIQLSYFLNVLLLIIGERIMHRLLKLDGYMAKLPVERQSRIADKVKRLSQSIEFAKLRKLSNIK